MLMRSKLSTIGCVALLTTLSSTAFADNEWKAWRVGYTMTHAACDNCQNGTSGEVERLFDEAQELAGGFGATLPGLPERVDNVFLNKVNCIQYSVADGVLELHAKLITEHGDQHAALFEVANKTTIVRMMYEPGESTSLNYIDLLSDRFPASRLPEELWKPVVEQIQQGAGRDAVVRAIDALHEGADEFLKAR